MHAKLTQIYNYINAPKIFLWIRQHLVDLRANLYACCWPRQYPMHIHGG